MTQFAFRDDAYRRTANAVVTAVHDGLGVELDRTVFYATSGGQPGDIGTLQYGGGACVVTGTIHPDGDKRRILHLVSGPLPAVGEAVTLSLDWDHRYALMRMHTALHLLSVAFPFPVTGGSIGVDNGRLDFDMPDVPEGLDAIERQLNAWVEADLPVTDEWITDEQMAAQPDLVKTMKVKPPIGQGRVRLVRIANIDLQPCGGTHIRSTAEIGPLRLGKIEKKGKQNRRVSLGFG